MKSKEISGHTLKTLEWDDFVQPLQPGYSISVYNQDQGPGTMGGFIYSPLLKRYYILSNAHVLTLNPFLANAQSQVVQPRMGDIDARIVSSTVTYTQFQAEPAINTLDAGIALIDTSTLGVPKPIYSDFRNITTITGVRNPVVGEQAVLASFKWNQISNVNAINLNNQVITGINPHNPAGPHQAIFNNITEMKHPAAGPASPSGASGAFWISTVDSRVILLNFSGGDDTVYAYGIPILSVLTWVQNSLGDQNAGILGPNGAVFT